MSRITQLGLLAISVAEAAGELVRDGRPAELTVSATKTSDVDIVTEMDTAAERLLLDRILDARPDDGVLGEEGGLRPGTSGLTWVLDPIDGTVNYLYGIGPYAVSVAVIEGEPDPAEWTLLAGCVHHPQARQSYAAGLDAGAFLDGRRLPGPNDVPLRNALIGTGFGYLAARRRRQAAVLAALLPGLRDIRRLGSAALDLCFVAEGRLDGYYERGLNPWDHAAGTLIAREAGAVVTGPAGLHPGLEMVVAGGPQLQPELLERLAELDAFSDE